MKKLCTITLLLILSAGTGMAQGGRFVQAAQVGTRIGKQVTRPNVPKQQQLRDRPNANNNRQPIENVVEGFYVSRFPEDVQVSDDQFVKILPVLRQTFRDLRDIAMRKRRAMNQLVQMTQRDDSEENLKRMIREVDKADEEYSGTLQKLFVSVDPHLTVHQQARFRVFQNRIDQQIRLMINQVNAAAQPPG